MKFKLEHLKVVEMAICHPNWAVLRCWGSKLCHQIHTWLISRVVQLARGRGLSIASSGTRSEAVREINIGVRGLHEVEPDRFWGKCSRFNINNLVGSMMKRQRGQMGLGWAPGCVCGLPQSVILSSDILGASNGNKRRWKSWSRVERNEWIGNKEKLEGKLGISWGRGKEEMGREVGGGGCMEVLWK